RNEDLALLSLIFTTRTQNIPPFDIQLIVPDEVSLGGEGAPGIMQRLSFLGGMRYLSSLPEYNSESIPTGNVFYDWLTMKTRQIESKGIPIAEDELLNTMLWEG
ncbi:unnamed protein product, partial [marine sediment metagenome]